jgi:hypothetical protein
MNDHQLEIAKALENGGDENIYVVYEEDQLEENILKVLKKATGYPLIENVGKMNLIRTIREFIERVQGDRSGGK